MAIWAHQLMDHPCVSVGTSHPENKQRNALRGNWGSGEGTTKLQRESSHICVFLWDLRALFCLAEGFLCTLERVLAPRSWVPPVQGGEQPFLQPPVHGPRVLGCCGEGRGATDRRREGSGPSSRQPQAKLGAPAERGWKL